MKWECQTSGRGEKPETGMPVWAVFLKNQVIGMRGDLNFKKTACPDTLLNNNGLRNQKNSICSHFVPKISHNKPKLKKNYFGFPPDCFGLIHYAHCV
jgi:hypothetical protein